MSEESIDYSIVVEFYEKCLMTIIKAHIKKAQDDNRPYKYESYGSMFYRRNELSFDLRHFLKREFKEFLDKMINASMIKVVDGYLYAD